MTERAGRPRRARIGLGSPHVPELIPEPVRVTAAGTMPKVIDEYVGRVAVGEPRVSVTVHRDPE
jgi:hypothetical protein